MKPTTGLRAALWLAVLVLLSQGQLGLRSMLLTAMPWQVVDAGYSELASSAAALAMQAGCYGQGTPVHLPAQGADQLENEEDEERYASSTRQPWSHIGSADPFAGLAAVANGVLLRWSHLGDVHALSKSRHLLLGVFRV